MHKKLAQVFEFNIRIRSTGHLENKFLDFVHLIFVIMINCVMKSFEAFYVFFPLFRDKKIGVRISFNLP
jgi:hypothetical protein